MITVFNIPKNIFRLLSLTIILTVLNSCGGSNPVKPVYKPEITALVGGELDLNYSAAGIITTSDTTISGTDLITTMATVMTVNDIKYDLSIYLVFPDRKEVNGTFDFTDKKGQYSGDYAVGAFEITQGSNQRSFISYWGKVTITKILGQTITGSFYFKAREENGTAIVDVSSGIINFTLN